MMRTMRTSTGLVSIVVAALWAVPVSADELACLLPIRIPDVAKPELVEAPERFVEPLLLDRLAKRLERRLID